MRAETNPRQICERLASERVIPVLRLETAELTIRAGQCLLDVGFGALEITMTTPGGLEVIKHFANKALVGAGTVLDAKTAQACLGAGAQFLVSPVLRPAVAREAHAAGAAALIGGFTPTEVFAAHHEGADIVKVFPASSGGPAHLGHLHSVFPQILLCPTGGVTLENMQKFFAAGASLVGIGNAVLPLDALKKGDLDAVRSHAAAYRGVTLA
jgi:2-dehydro-3-deoxyphosphogluconate aldolase/(4S)-4-hydroxy-2-oxoglutarate aldolase